MQEHTLLKYKIKNSEYKTEIIEEKDKTIINILYINPLEREMSKYLGTIKKKYIIKLQKGEFYYEFWTR